jgi:DNA replication protein DnaC
MIPPELEQKLKHLRLSGMAGVFPVRLQQAVSGRLSHQEFFELLVEDELCRRRDRLLERRLRQARFPEPKRLEDFSFDFNPTINRAQIFDLATGRFIAERRGWLVIGQTGVGKSHLIIGVGMRAVEAGHKVLYKSAFDLLEDLAEAAATGQRRSCIAELTRVPLLIVEDLGLRKVPPSAAEDLLEILHRRYQKTSTVISSNRPLEDWGAMLGGDSAAISALLDRFLHSCELTLIRGKSYRLYERQQRQKKGEPTDGKASKPAGGKK